MNLPLFFSIIVVLIMSLSINNSFADIQEDLVTNENTVNFYVTDNDLNLMHNEIDTVSTQGLLKFSINQIVIEGPLTIVETGSDTGQFLVELQLPDTINGRHLSQNDFVTMIYFDESDSTGNKRTVVESIPLTNILSKVDTSSNISKVDTFGNISKIGDTLTVQIYEPNANRDSKNEDKIPLSKVEYIGEGGIKTTLANPIFNPNTGYLIETGVNTSIFEVKIKIPHEIDGKVVDIGNWYEIRILEDIQEQEIPLISNNTITKEDSNVEVKLDKDVEISMNEKIQQITSKFYSSLELKSFLEPTLQDIERMRDFLGEDKFERIQNLSNKINSNSISQTVMSGYGVSGLTVEEELFLVEMGQSWIDFLKILINEKIKQVDDSYVTAVNELNELDILEEEKVKHLKAMEEQKTIFQTTAIQTMSKTFAKQIVLLEEKKIELEIKQEIISKTSLDSSNCGEGTIRKNGMCVVDNTKYQSKEAKGGGCLIATATYGSELAPQVQQLRELRDNSLLQTESGTNFMNHFNDFYYSFSPVIADYERENPVFKEMVNVAITPMVSSLSILNYVDMDSESSVLGYGISLIVLNGMMYVGIPASVIVVIRRF